ncbi:histidinol dehydrogenase [Buchnera aphidicola]|uniref:Histidinol dehydrogenase n=1 Tax=Buchnera aphidicola (Therioaphis trifolii) TaxID=1241884 RepID=A0A4D6YDI2_9GAMM|nr:histidinol dehydrogenase [Buchnera aphidicola]QCI27082.1 histidinol dehydrogenase [Buchnera aphidicola (Therioaphis trifolii)]
MLLYNEIIFWNDLNELQKKNILLRPKITKLDNFKKKVKNILNNVKNFGDDAILKYNKKFDNINLKQIKVSKDKINNSSYFLKNDLKNAILTAKKNIQLFHQNQKCKSLDIHTAVGIRCQQITIPIESVGLYVPAGSAPLLSTALMLAVPAHIAGCKNIVLCSPPPITNEILYISKICNIKNVFEVGGAQAIAALGFGTETVPKVNKIFGPGNMYVTEAKRQLNKSSLNVSIDMIAGPSELLIIADETSDPIFIASDILSQSEHGHDSQVIVLSDNISILKQTIFQVNQQIHNLSRKDIIFESLKNSKFILTTNLLVCTQISNIYAPEHLIIQSKYSRNIVKDIINAGSIFLGKWSPESVGDYASGTNHVLPTHGNSVFASGLSITDFQKKITIQELTPFGLKNIANVVKILSLSEKMDAHANAVIVRCNSIKDKYGK